MEADQRKEAGERPWLREEKAGPWVSGKFSDAFSDLHVT